MLAPWKKSYDQPRQHIKKQRHYFADKCPYSQSFGFSRSYVWMWELDHKEGWMLKNRCFWIAMLEKTLESSLNCREIIQSILKKINPEYSLEGLILKQKLQYFGHLMKSQLIRKDPDAGKHWRLEEKGMTEDERDGWHCWLNGREFELAPGDDERQGSLVGCSPRGHRVRHDWVTEHQQVNPKSERVRSRKASIFAKGNENSKTVREVRKSRTQLSNRTTGMISVVEHLFMYPLAICISSLENYLYKTFTHFKIRLFICLLLSCMHSLCVLDSDPWQIHGLQIFSLIP